MSNLFEVEPVKETSDIIEQTDHVEVKTDQFVPKSKTAAEMMRDTEVLAIADKVKLDDTVALYDLGKEPSDEMTSISGKLLNQLTVADTIGSTKTLDSLGKIAGQIEFKDLKIEQPKGIKGLFYKTEDALKTRVAKYQSIGGEVTQLFGSLKAYENTIQKRIDDMNVLADANLNYAKNLDQYIALLYVLRNRQEATINELKIQANSGDQDAQVALTKALEVADVLDKRAFDLEQSKSMAVINAPQISQTQSNNYNLIQQYHSAFINTIPALQTALTQAITALQQNYAQQGINAQKDATAKLMKENAQRLDVNNRFIAESSGKPMISTDDMQEIVNTIVNSVKETKVIEENNRKAREDSRVKMEEIMTSARQAGLN